MSGSLDALPLRQRKPPRISTNIPLFVRRLSDSSSSSSSPTNQNITPGTTPSTGIPQCFLHALCMHDFESPDLVHLPLHKDEVLTIIIKQEHSGRWAAMRPQGDRIGWIPSSFVLPLDRSKIVEYPDETLALWPYESLNDPPLSAVHDPRVPVSEDYTALSFRLVTPTNLVLYKGFFDGRVRNHKYEPLFSPPNDERSSNMEGVRVPPTPENPAVHRIQRLHPPSPLLSEPGAPQLVRPASPPLLDAASHHHPRPCRMGDQTSLLCLTTPVSSDGSTPELLNTEELPAALKSVAASSSLDSTYSDDGIDDRSRCFGLPMDFRPAGADQGVSDIKLLDHSLGSGQPGRTALCFDAHSVCHYPSKRLSRLDDGA